jgi:hypothetical protein
LDHHWDEGAGLVETSTEGFGVLSCEGFGVLSCEGFGVPSCEGFGVPKGGVCVMLPYSIH